MQHIKSARRGSDTLHSIIHPTTGERVYVEQAQTLAAELGWTVKVNTASFEVTIDTESLLKEFDPAKAVDKDNLPAKLGTDPMAVLANSWYEPKHDGARALMHFTPEGILMTGRRRNAAGEFSEWSANVPHIRNLPFDSSFVGVVLDAEIIVHLTAAHVASGTLGATMSVVGAHPETAIATQEKFGKAYISAFDAPFGPGGEDIRKLPLTERREVAKQVVAALASEYVAMMEGLTILSPAERKTQTEAWLAAGHEGAVAKDPTAAYGAKYGWLKIKQATTWDCAVVGFEFGKKGGQYEHTIGTLLLAVKDASTGNYQEVGKVVPGDNELRAKLFEQLKGCKTQADFLAQQMLVEISFQGVTKECRTRHARVLRYRTDKNEATVVDFETIEKI